MSQVFELVWEDWMHIVSANVRPGLKIPVGKVPKSPHKGILVTLREIMDPSQNDEWAHWDETVHIPDVLSCRGVMAVFKFMPIQPQEHHTYLKVMYLDNDPIETMNMIKQEAAQWKANGRYLEHGEEARKTRILSLYKPVVLGQR
ncbi:MAG: hypothetical protein HYX90_11100 [Chloroflexi bacterium]|nr:hypothetical protein [Chloroflexota bacterium]